jgi:hypothetical protein
MWTLIGVSAAVLWRCTARRASSCGLLISYCEMAAQIASRSRRPFCIDIDLCFPRRVAATVSKTEAHIEARQWARTQHSQFYSASAHASVCSWKDSANRSASSNGVPYRLSPTVESLTPDEDFVAVAHPSRRGTAAKSGGFTLRRCSAFCHSSSIRNIALSRRAYSCKTFGVRSTEAQPMSFVRKRMIWLNR